MNKRLLALLLKLSDRIPRRVVSQFGSLQSNLAKAGMKITFKAYLGLIVFASLIAGIVVFGLAFVLLSLRLPIIGAAVIALLAGVVAGLISVLACYFSPMLSISSRKRKIDANLPLIANFMAVLASAGMPPERIFRSLANVGDEFGVGEEVRRAIGDIELMGMDLKGALRAASLRSASTKFGALLDGIVTTTHMGGDLTSYLREEADKYKKVRVASMKSFLESLGGLAEVYVSMMIALPLALVVMLTIMSFLGGGAMLLGGLDPQVILTLLTFVITPAGVGIILLLVDSITPPR